MFKPLLKYSLVLLIVLISACSSMLPSVREEAANPFLDIHKQKFDVNSANTEAVQSEKDESELKEKQQQKNLDLQDEREADFNHKITTIMQENQLKQTSSPKVKGKKINQSIARQEVSLHFDNADLLEVIRLFMQQFLEQDFLVYPGVQGTVTMEIDDQLTEEQIEHLLEGILRVNGMTMYYQNSVWKILPLNDAPAVIDASDLLFPQQGSHVRGQRIQAYRLNFISMSELAKILTPYLSKDSQVYAHDPSGIILISDYPNVLEKVSRLIKLFDVSPFAGMNMKVYLPKYVLVDVLIKELDALSKGFSLPDLGPNSRLSFIALPRLNLLLAMSRDAGSLVFADAWIRELDREAPQQLEQSKEEGVFVYSVRNGSAKEIVVTLQGLFGVTVEKKVTNSKELKLPPGVKLTRLSSGLEKNKTKDPLLPGAVSGTLGGAVTFVVDEVTNAILVRSSSVDYHKVLPVIKRLDVYPKQVLIEVTIAEIQLDESSKLGIEWKYLMRNVAGTGADGLLSVDSGLGTISGDGESLIGSGLSYLLVNTGRFTAALKASSDQNRAHILSSPHILASDNKEAKIDIGDEVPIVTSEYRTTESSSTASTVDKTIQYRDVGVLLSVTPHIHENGMVQMEISQEISEISNKTVEGVNSPVFSKRAANTILSVRDGQTIVIAGLMQQSTSNSYSGVPFIGRIPLLRYLFGYEGRSFRNTELMIFITPHVILNEESSEFINRNFLERLSKIRGEMHF